MREVSLVQIAMLINMLVAVACVGGAAPETQATPTVQIGGASFGVEIADTPETRAQGLSGRPSLDDGYGMLFVFERAYEHRFWMKDMMFPLDFVWISEGCAVVDVTANVPPPEQGTETNDLPTYSPSAPVLYVLEIDAGTIAETGIEVGDAVAFSGFSGTGVVC